MNLRKLLYFPTDEQLATLTADVQRIVARCDKIASEEYRDLKDAKDSHDSVCPVCRTRKEGSNIVDRIASVEGKGKVDGDFTLGFGKVTGSMNIDTEAVNHCNTCGNEWKKFKIKYISKTDILRVALNYLGEMYENPKHNKKMSWKVEAIQVFDGCSAEAIYALIGKNNYYMRSAAKRYLTLSNLRVNFKSIFDG